MKNETMKNVAGIIILYLVLILGVIAVNARMEDYIKEPSVIALGN